MRDRTRRLLVLGIAAALCGCGALAVLIAGVVWLGNLGAMGPEDEMPAAYWVVPGVGGLVLTVLGAYVATRQASRGSG